MPERGHKEPLKDFQRSVDPNVGDTDPQLRIGQEVPATEPKPEVGALDSLLTEKERERVHRLVDSGQMNYLEAVLRTTSTTRARRIIGHTLASEQVGKLEKGAEERAQEQAGKNHEPTTEELVQLLRETSLPPESPGESTEKPA